MLDWLHERTRRLHGWESRGRTTHLAARWLPGLGGAAHRSGERLAPEEGGESGQAVANTVDSKACKELADNLNGREFVIEGAIEALDVVSYDGERVITIERIALEA
jgi:hypothetical protein